MVKLLHTGPARRQISHVISRRQGQASRQLQNSRSFITPRRVIPTHPQGRNCQGTRPQVRLLQVTTRHRRSNRNKARCSTSLQLIKVVVARRLRVRRRISTIPINRRTQVLFTRTYRRSNGGLQIRIVNHNTKRSVRVMYKLRVLLSRPISLVKNRTPITITNTSRQTTIQSRHNNRTKLITQRRFISTHRRRVHTFRQTNSSRKPRRQHRLLTHLTRHLLRNTHIRSLSQHRPILFKRTGSSPTTKTIKRHKRHVNSNQKSLTLTFLSLTLLHVITSRTRRLSRLNRLHNMIIGRNNPP